MGKYYISDFIYHIDLVLKRNDEIQSIRVIMVYKYDADSNTLPMCSFLVFLQSELTRYDVNGLRYEANLAKLMFERSVRV